MARHEGGMQSDRFAHEIAAILASGLGLHLISISGCGG